MKYRIVSFRTHWQMSYSLAGSIAQWLVYLLMDPAAPCLIPSIPKAFSKENVDRTHLVLASGKLVLQKSFIWDTPHERALAFLDRIPFIESLSRLTIRTSQPTLAWTLCCWDFVMGKNFRSKLWYYRVPFDRREL